MNRLPRRRLGRTDVKLTVLGLGGSTIGNLYRPVSERDATATIESGWRAGIRYFDTAPLYGSGLGEGDYKETLTLSNPAPIFRVWKGAMKCRRKPQEKHTARD